MIDIESLRRIELLPVEKARSYACNATIAAKGKEYTKKVFSSYP